MAERIGQATEQKRGKLMARKASGQVLPPKGKQRSWALRFTAYGKRRFVTLGRNGWNRQRAEAELENVLADVRRGIWQPHKPAPVDAPQTLRRSMSLLASG
jgi:hypothetical protein